MTVFEILSILTAWVQLGVIGFGLWLMQQSGQRRDKQIDEISLSLREQSAGIRALLERTA